MDFRRRPRSSSTTMTLESLFNLSMKTSKNQSQTSSCVCMINTSWFPAAAWLEDCRCVSPKHLMSSLRKRKNLFREVDHNIYLMGCAGTKTENPNKNADKVKSAAGPSNHPNSEQKANAAKPLPPTKLTQQQIEERRENMRRNLQEGNVNPPQSNAPHIEITLSS